MDWAVSVFAVIYLFVDDLIRVDALFAAEMDASKCQVAANK